MKRGGMIFVVLLLLAGAAAAFGRRREEEEEPETLELPNVFEVTQEPDVGDAIAWMVDWTGPVVLVLYLDRTEAIQTAIDGLATANPQAGFVLIPDRFADLISGGGAAGVDRFCEPDANMAIAVGRAFGDTDTEVLCFGPLVTPEEIAESVDPVLSAVSG